MYSSPSVASQVELASAVYLVKRVAGPKVVVVVMIVVVFFAIDDVVAIVVMLIDGSKVELRI